MQPNNSSRWNWAIWAAPILGLATFLSYPFVFLKWPMTRDVPWVNVLMLIGSLALVFAGIRRAFAGGRGLVSKIVAVPLAAIALFGVWSFGMLVMMPQHLPASADAPQVGQKIPDFVLPDANQRPVSLANLLSSPINARTPTKGVLLIFEMGHGCHSCSSELHDMQRHLEDFRAAGIRVVAVSNDPPDVARGIALEAGYTFTFLSDPKRDVIGTFDVSGPDDEPVRPAEFLVDANGVVRWRMLTTSTFVRARAQQVLSLAKLLG